MRICSAILVALLTFVPVLRASVAVNEVLANEPGSESALEWIELYNPSTTSAGLAFYELRVYTGTTFVTVPLSGTVAGEQYLVLCRNSVRFEERWGDSSGVWGDAPSEGYPIREASFQLANVGGRITLTDVISATVSELAWTETGSDGCSWERYHYLASEVGPSLDPAGATPGRINSITPLPVDLALEGVQQFSENGLTTIAFRIVNRGLSYVGNAVLELYEFDASGPDSLGELIAGESIGLVDSGITVLFVGQYRFPRYYQKLVAHILLTTDNRLENNRHVFTAPGEDYPPVILSEFLADPVPESAGEWVELKNVSDTTIDLLGWQLGDAEGYSPITDVELSLAPQEYLVLSPDSSAFRIAYPGFMGLLRQSPDWSTLNNGSDSLRLVDLFGLQADRFYYSETYDSNYTWARSESPENEGAWGRSEDAGGTPGEANRVRFTPVGSRTLTIDVTPRIISPDGDGIDDSATIKVEVSEAESYTLRLYDSQGRLVRTLEEEVPDLKEHYVWRGESDSGRKLPIGIYILYVEAGGVESAKKTIVVAR